MTPKASSKNTQTAGSAAAAPHNGFSLIPNQKLLAIYRAMAESSLLARKFGRQWGLRTGSEAVLAGVVLTLEPGDAVKAGALDPLAKHLRGRALEKLLPATAKRKTVAATTTVSASRAARSVLEKARTLRKAGKSRLAVAFVAGDLAGPWLAALGTAAREKLPLLFVHPCRAGDQAAEQNESAIGGVPRIPVDAADAVAVFRVATECAAHARRGNGPSLIECVHFPSQDASAPLAAMESYLRRKGLWREELPEETRAAFVKALSTARKAANR